MKFVQAIVFAVLGLWLLLGTATFSSAQQRELHTGSGRFLPPAGRCDRNLGKITPPAPEVFLSRTSGPSGTLVDIGALGWDFPYPFNAGEVLVFIVRLDGEDVARVSVLNRPECWHWGFGFQTHPPVRVRINGAAGTKHVIEVQAFVGVMYGERNGWQQAANTTFTVIDSINPSAKGMDVQPTQPPPGSTNLPPKKPPIR